MSTLIGDLIRSRYPRFNWSFLKGNGKAIDIPLANIKYVEAKGSLSVLHMEHYTRDQILVAQTIGECEIQLNDFAFLRIHRKYLVNLSNFQHIEHDQMSLKCGVGLPIARRRQKSIHALLDKYQLLL